MSAEELCITPDCGKKREWKGLCRSCYGQARHLIDKGKTTWEDLAEMGLIIPDAKPFTALFHRRMAQILKQALETSGDAKKAE